MDQTFGGPGATLAYSRTSDNRVNNFNWSADPNGVIAYVAAGGGWRVPNVTGAKDSIAANPSILFGAAEKVAATSNVRYTDYRTSLNGYDFGLTLLNAGTNNGLVGLTYSSIGFTSQFKSGLQAYPAYTAIKSRSFAFGFPTPANAGPTSGTYTYQGTVLGEATYYNSDLPPSTMTSVYRLSGSLSLTVNFSTGSTNGTLNLVGTDDQTGNVTNLGTYSLYYDQNGLQVSSASYKGTGMLASQFFGPVAQEFGGTTGLSLIDYSGSSTSRGNLYLTLAFATSR